MWATQPYRPPDPARPAISETWSTLAIMFSDPPTNDQWWMATVFDADVDADAEGQIRVRSAVDGVISRTARIGSYAGRVLIGWEMITSSENLIYVEGRRTVGTGGGVRLMRAEVSLMVEPPASQRDTIIYPPGYPPPAAPPYPPLFTTSAIYA
jgi:hypothetical protein